MKKEFVILLIILFSVSFISAAGLANSPWPMYQGGVKHGGQSNIDTSHVTGHVKWMFETEEAIESSPTIAEDGTIYVGDHANNLYAINPDGTEKWRFNAGEPVIHNEFNSQKGILSTPAISDDGTIYFSTLADYFFALNPDGSEKWKYKLPFTADTWTSPTIADDGTIYIGSARRYDENKEEMSSPELGELFALNPDGTLKWHFSLHNADMSASPAIADDGTVFSSTYNKVGDVQKGWLVAVNPDGTEKWKFEFPLFTESSPTIADDGTIYLGSAGGIIFAVNSDGTEKWRFQANDGVSSIPAVANDGTMYVGAWDAIFYAFNPDGTIKWQKQLPNKSMESITSSAAIGKEGTIYVGGADGIYAFNPDGTIKWHYNGKMGGVGSSPAIGNDGTIYIGSWDHHLYAFSEGKLTEPVEKEPEEETQIVGDWNPNDEGIDCFNPPSKDVEEKCDNFCNDNPSYCPDYSEREKGEAGKMNFFQRIIDWFKKLFSGK